MKFDELVLQSLSQKEMKNMQSRLDGLAKPVKSLGRLEELAVHLAGIYRTCNFTVQPRTCLVFAADNGVVKEGVSATPKAVTAIQAVNMVNGHTAVAALARAYNSKIEVFDVGIDSDKALPGVHCYKIRRSTNDMLLKPAMSYAQAVKAVEIGFTVGKSAFTAGNQLISVGELGMGNTTAASAIIAALLQLPGEKVVGKGSNISDKRLQHKIKVVDQSLQRAHLSTSQLDPFEVLRQVGSFEIGSMSGAIIAAAATGIPVLIDGFLSYAATLLAQRIVTGVTNYVISTHISHEQGSSLVLKELHLQPYIDLQMCVGEGSGAMMLLPWLDGIESILKNMNTLKEMKFDFQP